MNRRCLFCRGTGPFSTVEHIFPESMGNTEWVLRGRVCDSCQNYFGTEIENFVLNKSVLAWGRLFGRAQTKKGKMPRVDMALPKGGIFGAPPPNHSPLLGRVDSSGAIHFELPAAAPEPQFKDGLLTLHASFSTIVCLRLAQFSLKAGLETLAVDHPDLAHGEDFEAAREYARKGSLSLHWPVYVQLTAKNPAVAEKELSYTLFPYTNGTLWFEFKYVGITFRINLLHPGKFHPAPGYRAIW